MKVVPDYLIDPIWKSIGETPLLARLAKKGKKNKGKPIIWKRAYPPVR